MVVDEDADRPVQRSHVFVLRMWPEDLGSGRTDWRGRIQHINSGEARYFRDWSTLEAFVRDMMLEINPEGTPTDGVERNNEMSFSP